jgi:uncharacterized protein
MGKADQKNKLPNELIMDFKETAEINKILEIRVGSHLFGTNTPTSDQDFLGIFMPYKEIIYGFQKCEEVDLSIKHKDEVGRNTSEAIDRHFHEFRKFVQLALQNNPNILHVLFVDKKNIVYMNEIGQRLLEKALLFPHKGAYHRFVKYADSQRHKMQIQPENYTKLEQGLEVLLKENPLKAMGELRNKSPFVDKGKDRHIVLGDLNFEAGVYVKNAIGMIEHRLKNATNRVELYTKYGFDTKFGANLIQLLLEGIELLSTGKIEMPLKYRQDILDIKKGKHSAEDIMNWSARLIEEAREAYESSELPSEPRVKELEKFAIKEVERFLTS